MMGISHSLNLAELIVEIIQSNADEIEVSAQNVILEMHRVAKFRDV